MRRVLLACGVAAVALPIPVVAQSIPEKDARSHFGVIATFSPPSDLIDTFKILFDAERADVTSQDFEIGFVVRGRHLGGDWGVSYVQKTYKDGSFTDNTSDFCANSSCFKAGTIDVMQDVQLRGVSIHKFVPFVTIKRRAQIGLNFSGGVAQARGRAARQEFDIQAGVAGALLQTETVTQVDAKRLFLEGRDTIPIWKVEFVGAALLAPGLKVRIGAGLNFTNYPAASISASYLINTR